MIRLSSRPIGTLRQPAYHPLLSSSSSSSRKRRSTQLQPRRALLVVQRQAHAAGQGLSESVGPADALWQQQQQQQQEGDVEQMGGPPSLSKRRRVVGAALLAGWAAAASGTGVPAACAGEVAAGAAVEVEGDGPAPGDLARRLASLEGLQEPLQFMAPWLPKQIEHPRWLFGEWDVESTFANVTLPLGPKFVPEGFLQVRGGGVWCGVVLGLCATAGIGWG
jgi:hypothetical protein